MKCPFRKITTHIREIQPMGCTAHDELSESFDDCFKNKCMAWIASSEKGSCLLMSVRTPKI